MSAKILVATPIRSFGELVAQALQEVGYYPLLVADVANALDALHVESFSLAILDCKMPPPGTEFLAMALREQSKDLRFIFLHPDDSCRENITVDPVLDLRLPQPFYLPDLLSAVEQVLPEYFSPPAAYAIPLQDLEIPSELAWLQDVNQAAQYLTRLSLESDAQAALILRYAKIWAYAGQLPQNGAEELAHLVGEHWANGDGGDLARFVRLNSTGAEYMVYATGLGTGFVLALAYEAEMPFSKMRAQTGKLARKLTSPLPELNEDASIKTAAPPKRERLPDIEDFTPDDWVQEDDEAEGDFDDALLARQAAMFDELLASLDIPDPNGVSPAHDLQLGTALDSKVEMNPSEPAIIPDVRPLTIKPLVVKPEPIVVAQPESEILLEPTSASLHDLAYACVLIPRLPGHLLTGDLNLLLNQALSRLCLAFDWRLEHLAIRPQYLHWVVSVSPDVSPAELVRTIRQQTSALIFEELPRLARENPSGDFWASGFMVVHGHHSLTAALLQDFIRQTRNRQGLETN